MMTVKKTKAFTLVELLVVISIVGLLVGLAVPTIRNSVAKARQAGCLNNLRQIGIGLQGYLQDHDGELPEMNAMRLSKDDDVPVMDTVLLGYVGNDPEIFHCPAENGIFKNSGSSYWWYETVTLKASGTHNYKNVTLESFFLGTSELSKIPLILDKESFHRGASKVNALYADGHAGPLMDSIPKNQ